MCSWYGIVCTPLGYPYLSDTSVECRVAEHHFGANGLRGPIAPAVEQSTALTRLDLGDNVELE